jgi:hypothetical protein
VWVELGIVTTIEKGVPIVAHAGAVDIVLGTTGYHPETVMEDEASVERLAGIFR